MTKKERWIRERCVDKFEGIPCDYPNCTCSESNKAEMEKEYERDEQ